MNPILEAHEVKTFAEVLRTGLVEEPIKQVEEEQYAPLKPLVAPRMVGSNVTVEIDEGEYIKAVEELKHSVIGKLSLPRGVEAPSTITDLKVIPLGRGIF